MLHFKRRAIAYIAGRLISEKDSRAAYDYSLSSYFNYSGVVSSKISVYDYSRSCHLSGTNTSIYDFGTSQFVKLDVNGNEFSGYDFETSNHFKGKVNSNAISFFDFQDEQYYNFSI